MYRGRFPDSRNRSPPHPSFPDESQGPEACNWIPASAGKTVVMEFSGGTGSAALARLGRDDRGLRFVAGAPASPAFAGAGIGSPAKRKTGSPSSRGPRIVFGSKLASPQGERSVVPCGPWMPGTAARHDARMRTTTHPHAEVRRPEAGASNARSALEPAFEAA